MDKKNEELVMRTYAKYTINNMHFVVYGGTNNIANGQASIFNSAGASDYWGPTVSYVDSATKNAIKIIVGGGRVYFPANHDLYLIKVKN